MSNLHNRAGSAWFPLLLCRPRPLRMVHGILQMSAPGRPRGEVSRALSVAATRAATQHDSALVHPSKQELYNVVQRRKTERSILDIPGPLNAQAPALPLCTIQCPDGLRSQNLTQFS